jgi:hypothetical protein
MKDGGTTHAGIASCPVHYEPSALTAEYLYKCHAISIIYSQRGRYSSRGKKTKILIDNSGRRRAQ